MNARIVFLGLLCLMAATVVFADFASEEVDNTHLTLHAVNAKTGELLNKGKHGGKKLTSVNAKTGKVIKANKLHLKPVNAKTGKLIKANKLHLKPVNSKTGKPIKPSALKLKTVDTNTGLKPTRVPPVEKDAITAHPNMAKYKLWQETKLDAEGFDVRFSVKGKNDAHIVFMCNKQERNSEAYEVVLGGWQGKRSVVRKGTQGVEHGFRDEDLQSVKPRLTTDKFTTYWISYNSKEQKLKVFTGKVSAPILVGFRMQKLDCDELNMGYGAWDTPVTFASRYVYHPDINKEHYYDHHIQALHQVDVARADLKNFQQREKSREQQRIQDENDRKRQLQALKVVKSEIKAEKKEQSQIEKKIEAKAAALKKKAVAVQKAKAHVQKEKEALKKKKAAVQKAQAHIKAEKAKVAAAKKAVQVKKHKLLVKHAKALKLKAVNPKTGKKLTAGLKLKLTPVNPKTGKKLTAGKKLTLKPVSVKTGKALVSSKKTANKKAGAKKTGAKKGKKYASA